MRLMIKDFPDELAEKLDAVARSMVPPTTRNQLLLAVLQDYVGSRPAPVNRLHRPDPAEPVRFEEKTAA